MNRPRPIAFIEALRATACLMVVYTHIVAGRADAYGVEWPPYVFVRDYVAGPLGVIQNFGFLGVALFFLVSGFIITHSAQKERRSTFVVRRLLRIYPTLWWALVLVVAVHQIDLLLTGAASAPRLDSWEYWASFAGLNPVFGANSPIPVAWTLAIELFFYVHVLVFLPALQRRPLVGSLAFTLWPVAAVSTLMAMQAPQLALMHEYLPVFGMGVAMYFGWTGVLTPRVVSALMCAQWVAFVFCLRSAQPSLLAHPTNYSAQIFIALGIFLGASWAMGPLWRSPRFVAFFSDISYSLYLLHLPIGVLLMDRLYPIVGFSLAAVVSLAISVAVSYATYIVVERPSQQAARRLTRPQAEARIGGAAVPRASGEGAG